MIGPVESTNPKLSKKKMSESKKGIQTTGTLGHKWYRNIQTGERQMFINKLIPDGWVTSDEYKTMQRENMKKGSAFNKHWYNDGVKSYLRYDTDCNGLTKGRLKT